MIARPRDIECFSTRRCRLRSCAHCMTAKGSRQGYHLNRRIIDTNFTALCHITLTLSDHSRAPSSQVPRLLAAFNKLKERKAWTDCITGGVRKVETTYRHGQWHVHMHVLAEISNPATIDAIAPAWADVSDGSIADIRPVENDTHRTNVAYYITKPAHDTLLMGEDRRPLHEWIRQTRGRRLLATFGSWRGKPLLPRRSNAPQTAVAAVVPIAAEPTAPTAVPRTTCNNRGAKSDPTALPTTCNNRLPNNNGEQTTELACSPSISPPTTRMDGCLAKERSVSVSDNDAREESKADIPCEASVFRDLVVRESSSPSVARSFERSENIMNTRIDPETALRQALAAAIARDIRGNTDTPQSWDYVDVDADPVPITIGTPQSPQQSWDYIDREHSATTIDCVPYTPVGDG